MYANDERTGDYAFRLLDLSQSTPVTVGTPVTGQTLSPGSETDVFTFTATAGQLVWLDNLSAGTGDSHWRLLDPYGRAVAVPEGYSRLAASQPGDNTAFAMKSVVADTREYDGEGDAPLKRPFSSTVIYEMHVRGFTAHPNSGVSRDKRGTYAGLIEKIRCAEFHPLDRFLPHGDRSAR